MAINQQHIAEKLNISVATVSRSLKNDLSISAQTRAMVLEAARRMGYNTPSAFRAKASADEMAPICALIQSDREVRHGSLEETMVPGVLSGMSNAIAKYGSSLIVHYVPLKDRDRACDPQVLPPLVRNGNVSGIVLIHYYPKEVASKLAENYLCTSIIHDYRLPNVDIANINQAGAINCQVDKLYYHKHRNIGFMGQMKINSYSRARCAAYLESMLAHGMPFQSDHIFDISEGLSDDLMSAIIGKIKNGMTAVVCENDHWGYLFMSKLQQSGLRVPQDVSITGYDSEAVPPGLVKLHSAILPSMYLGAAAVELLHDRLEQPAAPAKQTVFDCSVVDGDSIIENNR